MRIGRRAWLAAALAVPWGARAVALPGGAHAHAQPLLSLVVGSAPGRGADPSARAFAPFLERHLRNVRVAVLNRPGAAGLAALRLLAAADPDGSTLGWVASPILPARLVDGDLPGTTPDLLARLRLVAAVQAQPLLLVTHPGTGPATLPDLLRRIATPWRSRESPGDPACQPLATPPEGSAGHLAALQLQAREGTLLNIVAFPTAAAARHAVEAGHAAAALLALGDVHESLALATLATIPNPIAPPTILRGLALPATAPDSRAEALANALRGIAADPEFIAAGTESGFRPAFVPGPEWTAKMRAEHAALAQLWRLTPWTPPPTLAG